MMNVKTSVIKKEQNYVDRDSRKDLREMYLVNQISRAVRSRIQFLRIRIQQFFSMRIRIQLLFECRSKSSFNKFVRNNHMKSFL